VPRDDCSCGADRNAHEINQHIRPVAFTLIELPAVRKVLPLSNCWWSSPSSRSSLRCLPVPQKAKEAGKRRVRSTSPDLSHLQRVRRDNNDFLRRSTTARADAPGKQLCRDHAYGGWLRGVRIASASLSATTSESMMRLRGQRVWRVQPSDLLYYTPLSVAALWAMLPVCRINASTVRRIHPTRLWRLSDALLWHVRHRYGLGRLYGPTMVPPARSSRWRWTSSSPVS